MQVVPASAPSGPASLVPGGWADMGAVFPQALAPCLTDGTPYVMFDDARGAAHFRLYHDPDAVIVAHSLDEVIPCLQQIRAAVRQGYHAAGYLAYEAGFAFEPRLAKLPCSGNMPLLWFGIFRQPHLLASSAIGGALEAEPPRLSSSTGKPHYLRAVNEILDFIAAGDCYQINFTIEGTVETQLQPQALFQAVRRHQKGGWGGMLSTGSSGLLSWSPELFFSLDNRTIWTKPMKGTAKRGPTPDTDNDQKCTLRASAKERAENLMIVDLLRNDLGRIAQPGSVRVDSLFAIETYPTLHQMTSSISAQLKDGLDAIDIVRCLFPCGSITGAPKIRAMEIIAALERRFRGPYTGSMGFIAPDGQSAFNVMIRTLVYPSYDFPPQFAVGSGIVADSVPEQEWQECNAKSAFLTAIRQPERAQPPRGWRRPKSTMQEVIRWP